MFVTCDQCGGRFKIAPEKVPAAGVRARCTGCPAILLLWKEGEQVMSSTVPLAPKEPPHAPLPAGEDPRGAPPAGSPAASLGETGPPPAWTPGPELPPPPPPEPEPEASPADRDFAAIFGDVAGRFDDVETEPAPPWEASGSADLREPSFVSDAIPLDEESADAVAVDEASPVKDAKAGRAPPMDPPSKTNQSPQKNRLWPRGRKPEPEGPLSQALWSLIVVA
ncbi:MAG TPA: zinc-ribbon domain-containing protein, partial [Vulgatibacter sp.]